MKRDQEALEQEVRGYEQARQSAAGLAVLIASAVENIADDLDNIEAEDALRVAAELLVDRLDHAEEAFGLYRDLAKRCLPKAKTTTPLEATAN